MNAHRLKFFLLSSLAALSCLGASVGMTFYFNCTIGPLCKGRSAPVSLDYYDTDFPKVTAQLMIYSDKTKSTSLYSSNSSSGEVTVSNGNVTHWLFETSIPSSFTAKYQTFFFELVLRQTQSGWWFPETKTTTVNAFVENLDGSKNYTELNQYCTLTPIRPYYEAIGTNSLSVVGEKYYITNWHVDTTGNQYHGINLSTATLGYAGLHTDDPMGGSATLRVYTNPTLWNIGSLTMINGRLTRLIPLKITQYSSLWLSGRKFLIYQVSLQDTYAVDRYDLKMYPLSQTSRLKSYFLSNDLFIPTRNQKDMIEYRFSISYANLGLFSDSITLDFSFVPGSRLFGNCEDAQYCVGLG